MVFAVFGSDSVLFEHEHRRFLAWILQLFDMLLVVVRGNLAALKRGFRGFWARTRQGFRARVFRMTICLAHISALQYWRAVRCGLRPKPRAARVALPSKTNRSEIASLRNAPWSQGIFSGRIHVAVSCQNGMRTISGATCHCLSGAFISKGLMRIDRDTFVLSPEATFLQLAQFYPFEQLALLAFELCGGYSHVINESHAALSKAISGQSHVVSKAILESNHVALGTGSDFYSDAPNCSGAPHRAIVGGAFVSNGADPAQAPGSEKNAVTCNLKPSFVPSVPICSVASLLAFADSAAAFPGCARARKALRYVLDRSASPAESRLVLLLCAKRSLGGYGLPLPQMNYRVDVVGEGRKCTSHKYFVLDLFWENARLDVEYDSDAFHASKAGIASDAERRNALVAMGYTVITVTNGQMSSVDSFDDVAFAVARALRVRIRRQSGAWGEKRYAFRYRVDAAQRSIESYKTIKP